METTLITGGSSGIGLAIAKQLAQNPCHLVLLGRSLDKLAHAKSEIAQNAHPQTLVTTISADITNFEDLREKLQQEVETIDCLIHSAGKGLALTFEDSALEDFHSLIQANFFGAVNISKLVLPGMKNRNRGRIVYISSVAGLLGIYGYTCYSSSKFALEGFAQSLRNELKSSNIRVSVVYPPDVDTPMLAEENKQKPEVTKAISGGNLMTPEAVAKKIIRATRGKKFRVIPGFGNWLNCLLIIHFPNIVFAYIDLISKRKSLSL